MTDERTVAFEIDGREYEWPGLSDLTMRECRIFHEETGLVWESIWVGDVPLKDVFIREGFLAAMARIAYTREHPEAKDDDVRAVIENQPRMNIFKGFLEAFQPDEPDEDADPKAGAAGSGETSSSPMRNEPGSTPNGETTGGTGSTPSSDTPDGTRAVTGNGRSGTPSTSVPLRSVI